MVYKMKALDVLKVLMGIMSDRDCVKRFKTDNRVFGVYKEFDYGDMFKVVKTSVQEFYFEETGQILDKGKKTRRVMDDDETD